MIIRESDYYIWLSRLVGNRRNYTKLVKQLDTIPYEWIFTLDANRSEGGKSLRIKYAYEASLDADDIRKGPCTVLEMLIGVADHMTDQIGGYIMDWFWVMINNLKLADCTDASYNTEKVERTIKAWLKHDFNYRGDGSIFPLKSYPGDCRNLDVWSQMNAWIAENYPEDGSWLD